MSDINLQLFDQIKKHVLAEPKSMNMGYFCRFGEDARNDTHGLCDTAGCIAGWAMLLMGMKKPLKTYSLAIKEGRDSEVPQIDEAAVAEALLGISHAEACELFYFHTMGVRDYSPYQALGKKIECQKPGSVPYSKTIVEAIDLCLDRHRKGIQFCD